MNQLVKKATLFIVAALSLTACGKTETTTEEIVRKERVQVMELTNTEIAREVDFSTVLQGYETLNVAPSLTGRIEEIFVEVGDKVAQGDMLVRMDQNQYNTTKLAYTNLTIEMQRMKALREAGSVSQQLYDQTELSYNQTQESLAFLEENTFVKAPFQGVIAAKNYEDGELYGGQPILMLTQVNKLKAFINIPETYYPLVKKGMEVTVTSDIYPEKTFSAVIEVVFPTIDAASHTFQAKLRIPNAQELLRPGMYAKTNLSLGKVNTIVVPYQAVLKLQGANDRYVFLNDNGVAKRVAVTLGQRFDDQVEIISEEIHAGDQLIVVGQARLYDGVALDIVPNAQ